MTRLLLSLDELDRVKRMNGISSTTELATRTGVSRNTWTSVVRTRRLSDSTLQALHQLGGRPDRLMVAVETVAEDTDDPSTAA